MRLFLILYCCLVGQFALAQLAPLNRLEFPMDEQAGEAYDLMPLGEQGALLVYHRHDTYGRRPHTYQFTRVDTALTTRWKADYTLGEKVTPSHSFINQQFLFSLATETNAEDFSIMRLNLDDGTLDTYAGKLPSSITVTHFKVMGNMAYLAGYYRSRPLVMGFSLFDGTIRVFQGLYINHVELSSIEVDEYRQEIHVVTNTLKRNCQFTLRSYSPDGKPLRVIEYGGSQYSLISGKVLPISADESLLVGNYSTDCTPYSQGIYITRIRHNETGKLTVTTNGGEAIRYVDFGKLKHFFDYMPAKRQERMKARLAQQNRLGKEYTFRYRLQVHELIPTPGGLQLVAEVYYPQYRGSLSPYAARAWRTMSPPVRTSPGTSLARPGVQAQDRLSDGYRYTHAFICEFDQQGNLLWDNCLPISELTDNTLTQKVQISPQGNRMVLAYEQDSDVQTRVIERDSVLFTGEPYKIGPGTDKDRVQSSADEGLTAWFGPYFLATGYQKIVPDRHPTAKSRDVFYVQKLAYDAHRPPTPAALLPNPKRTRATGSNR